MTSTLQQKKNEEMKESIKGEQGVLVKFNCTTAVSMIPDSVFEKEKETMKTMRYEKYNDFVQRLQAGSPFENRTFKIGDIETIPSWYYEAHKDDISTLPMSNSKFRDKGGNLTPFNADEAVMHGYYDDPAQTTVKVKRFEKVEEMEKVA